MVQVPITGVQYGKQAISSFNNVEFGGITCQVGQDGGGDPMTAALATLTHVYDRYSYHSKTHHCIALCAVQFHRLLYRIQYRTASITHRPPHPPITSHRTMTRSSHRTPARPQRVKTKTAATLDKSIRPNARIIQHGPAADRGASLCQRVLCPCPAPWVV